MGTRDGQIGRIIQRTGAENERHPLNSGHCVDVREPRNRVSLPIVFATDASASRPARTPLAQWMIGERSAGFRAWAAFSRQRISRSCTPVDDRNTSSAFPLFSIHSYSSIESHGACHAKSLCYNDTMDWKRLERWVTTALYIAGATGLVIILAKHLAPENSTPQRLSNDAAVYLRCGSLPERTR